MTQDNGLEIPDERHPALRVCNIIEEGRLGGPQVRITEVAKRLKAFGVETTVLLPELDSTQFIGLLRDKGVSYETFRLYRLTKVKAVLVRYVLNLPYELFLLYQYFRKNRFDIIHCSGGSWQFKGLIAARLSGTPAIWHLNDTKMPWIFRALFRVLAHFFPQAIIVAADRTRQYYGSSMLPQGLPVFEIQAPVDTAHFTPGLTEPFAAIAAHDGPKIVTTGSVNPAKDIETFIRMAHEITHTRSDCHFFIVGPTHDSQLAYKETLDRLIADLDMRNVTFVGFQKDIRSILEAADVYVCSSRNEASPLAVWEAMSMKKPIAATDVGDVARFIENGRSGCIVQPEDHIGLAHAVLQYIGNRDLCEQHGEAARRAAIKHLDIQVVTRNHADAYRTVIDRAHSLGR